MERTLYKSLIKWKIKEDRKPLILNGARQVGKTYILKEFGNNNYSKEVHINLEANTRAREAF